MLERYGRQTIMPSIGRAGQEKLKKSRVLVLGAGGLGSPALYYIAAAGIGTIGVADYDEVSLSNLNRQILHTQADLGMRKAQSAKAKLHAINSEAVILTHEEKLDEHNIESVLSSYDIIVDCVDNDKTRLLAARACNRLSKTIVEAGINGFNGYVMSAAPHSACFACFNGAQPKQAEQPIPALGVTAGIAGSLQAAECIKLLLGIGEALINRVLFFDVLDQDYETIGINKNTDCSICGGLSQILFT